MFTKLTRPWTRKDKGIVGHTKMVAVLGENVKETRRLLIKEFVEGILDLEDGDRVVVVNSSKRPDSFSVFIDRFSNATMSTFPVTPDCGWDQIEEGARLALDELNELESDNQT